MPYINLPPYYLQRYSTGRSVYLGPTTPINYGVMSTRVDPDTGEMTLTGFREERGQFPVLPGFFLPWILMAIWTLLSGWLFRLFGVKKKENPLRLDFHMGYINKEYGAPGCNGNGMNGKKTPYGGNGNSWENDLTRELYRFD